MDSPIEWRGRQVADTSEAVGRNVRTWPPGRGVDCDLWGALPPMATPNAASVRIDGARAVRSATPNSLSKRIPPIPLFAERKHVRSLLVARIEGDGIVNQAQDRHEDVALDNHNNKATENG